MKTTAVLDGDHWVINGHKWFTTNANYAGPHVHTCLTHAARPPPNIHTRSYVRLDPRLTLSPKVGTSAPATAPSVHHRHVPHRV